LILFPHQRAIHEPSPTTAKPAKSSLKKPAVAKKSPAQNDRINKMASFQEVAEESGDDDEAVDFYMT